MELLRLPLLEPELDLEPDLLLEPDFDDPLAERERERDLDLDLDRLADLDRLLDLDALDSEPDLDPDLDRLLPDPAERDRDLNRSNPYLGEVFLSSYSVIYLLSYKLML